MSSQPTLAAGTRSSIVVQSCQVCGASELEPVLFLGYLPPVNQMRTIGERPHEQPAYPAQILRCPRCELVQLGLIVDPQVLFPPEYPYTSGTTKILRDNFAELYRECSSMFPLGPKDLVIDIGSNDGTLLSNFVNGGHPVCGIEPTLNAELANRRGIRTVMEFFNRQTAERVRAEYGEASVITAANVFAHIENIGDIVDAIAGLLTPNGVFISESHYLVSLIETLQYDTVYHEHLRHYSLTSLQYLLNLHGLEAIHARRIPTHGGSFRVYAARRGVHAVRPSVGQILAEEEQLHASGQWLGDFRRRVVQSKLDLLALLRDIKRRGERLYGVGAPSRASTLINYVGLDDGILDCVLEIRGSHKIGKYMPGTLIPVVEESRLFEQPPEYALLFSWHIAEELIGKLRAKGYRGKFIIPLPQPTVVNE